ncbi:FRG domain-containing protein [Paenibacillus sp. ALJ109b]|uniref:FRG domain-containing protein n=1 Tax=Paenibacillus sp. ALJ109b TaxID=2709068 RepID=UPI0013D4E161|nr:FRG domain-containing protein [Paenibacillus sp. ALJ109b]NEU59632.1 FRG domain-containing protein [Paenibacillus sp. ALJ109b]
MGISDSTYRCEKNGVLRLLAAALISEKYIEIEAGYYPSRALYSKIIKQLINGGINMEFSPELINFFNEIREFKEFHGGREIWFRGQTHDFPLNSGLFRPGKVRSLAQIKQSEKSSYRYFLSLGHPYLNGEKDWELLFIMQHHGVRTRLLDWTPALMNALYFCVENPGDQVLWLLNPSALNYLNGLGTTILTLPIDVSYEELLESTTKKFLTAAIHPVRNSARQVIQQGMFTIQGDSNVPLEFEWGGDIITRNILKKIPISKTLEQDIKYFLQLSNIDYFTVYPDLDGLSKHLNKRIYD